MARFITPVSSFKAGVLSKRLYSRTDIREYPEGLSVGKNAFVGKHGGAYKRTGLQNMFEFASAISDVQIESVQVGLTTTAFLVFQLGWVRVYDETGQPVSAFYPTSSSAKLGQFQVTYYDGKIIVTHSNGETAPFFIELDQSGDIVDVGFVKVTGFYTLYDGWRSSPHSSPNADESKKLTLTAATNPTAAAPVLTMTSIGFNLQDEFFVDDFVMISGLSTVQSVNKVGSNIYKIVSIDSATTATVTGFFSQAANGKYDIMFNMRYYGATPDTLQVDYGVGAGPFVSPEYTEWSYALWSDNRGWPRTVSVDEGRVIFGGNKENPATIWGSKMGNPHYYFDRRVPVATATFTFGVGGVAYTWTHTWNAEWDGGVLSTDPYNFTIGTARDAAITFMRSSVSFIVGTGRQEFVVSGNGESITQKNISIRPHTSHGSSPISLVYDNTVLFVSRSRQQIYMFRYSEQNGSFIAKEVSILNSDLFDNDKIKSMDWAEELSIAFIVTDNGKLISLTLNNETATTAFTEHEIDGTVLDAAYSIDAEGDYITIAVRRNTGTTAAPVNKVFFERLSRGGFNTELTLNMSILRRNDVDYLDDVRVLNYEEESSQSTIVAPIRWLETTQDYFAFNVSRFLAGDKISFIDTDAADPLATIEIDGSPIAYNTDYFMVPIDNGTSNGFGLASSYANATAPVPVIYDITNTDPETFLIFNDTLDYKITRVNDKVPVNSFKEGDNITFICDEDRFSALPPVEFLHTITAADATNGYVDVTGPRTDVNGNSINLGACDGIAYGKLYDFEIATMPIEAGQRWGTAQMGCKRVDTAMVRMYNTKSYEIGTDGYNYEERTFDTIDSRRDDVKVQGTPEHDHVVYIRNRKAEPCYIASLALRGVSNDG